MQCYSKMQRLSDLVWKYAVLWQNIPIILPECVGKLRVAYFEVLSNSGCLQENLNPPDRTLKWQWPCANAKTQSASFFRVAGAACRITGCCSFWFAFPHYPSILLEWLFSICQQCFLNYDLLFPSLLKRRTSIPESSKSAGLWKHGEQD